MAPAGKPHAGGDEGDQFVITADARGAVEGREETILDALNIPFRDGRPHITCPYPDHGGENDWRWHPKRARAICTCSKGDSIFDVMMKIDGVSFDAAKIRCMEIIGRADLIKVRGQGRGEDPENSYQKSTAAGLMAVKAEFRDDALVSAYLAYRLDIADDEVFLPTTRIRGITKMPYWEAGGAKKIKSIGSYPIVVFETIDVHGKIHAHRIYVAPNGKGKADLGKSGKGYVRDAKKSSKKVDDNDNINGRSVIWGDATRAEHFIITEGIETGAAVAHAFRYEVEAGDVVVAAAISANGVEAFQPWPQTKRVTIAADRDDAQKRGREGSQRGEEAAREFALRQFGKLKVYIAMPGQEGQSLDWLDVHCADGTDAVKSGILAAQQFVATKEELAERRRRVDRRAELEQIAREYPLPALNTKQLTYAHDAHDRVMVHKVVVEKKPGQQPQEFVVPVMTPIGVTARLRHADQSNGFGLRIVVQDMNGYPRQIDVERSALAKMAAADIRSLLFEAGLRTEDDGEAIAVACLKAAQSDNEIMIYRRPGWHHVDGHDAPIFITPAGEVIGAPPDMPAELQSSVRMAPDVASAGSFDGWREAIEHAVGIDDCQHWVVGAIAGFAAPLISLVGMDTCGINFSGLSSSGKSTAQRLAVSAWSTVQPGRPGLFQSARATSNAVEAMAQRSNATILSMDELAHVTGRELTKMIYAIAGGVGRGRMKADASMRESYSWSTFTLLSAESSLEEKITSDGGEWMLGMAVRIPDVDVTGINRNVSPDVMAIINSVERNYGHAGPAFIRKLVESGVHRRPIELRELINANVKIIVGETTDSGILRAAIPFAILQTAGQLAVNSGILPKATNVARAITWAWTKFRQSSGAVAMSPDEQAVTNLRLWIADRWGSTLRQTDAEVSNRETVGWYDSDAVYIPTSRLREASGGALKEEAVAKILSDSGMLAKTEHDRLYIRWIPKIGKNKAYALTRREFGRAGTDRDTTAFRSFQGGLT